MIVVSSDEVIYGLRAWQRNAFFAVDCRRVRPDLYGGLTSSFVSQVLSALCRPLPLVIIVLQFQYGTRYRHFIVVCLIFCAVFICACVRCIFTDVGVVSSYEYDEDISSSVVATRFVLALCRFGCSKEDSCGFTLIS